MEQKQKQLSAPAVLVYAFWGAAAAAAISLHSIVVQMGGHVIEALSLTSQLRQFLLHVWGPREPKHPPLSFSCRQLPASWYIQTYLPSSCSFMVLKCFGLSDTVNVFSCCLLVLCVNMLRMDHYTVLLSLSTGQASSILPSRRQEEPVDLFNLTLIPLSLSHYINWMSGSFFPLLIFPVSSHLRPFGFTCHSVAFLSQPVPFTFLLMIHIL